MSGWSDQRLRRLAWVAWWVTAFSAIAGLVITSIGAPEESVSWGSGLLGEYAFAVVVLTFPLVGLVILIRQPRNRVGWLMQGIGLAWGLPAVLDGYAHWGLVVDLGSLPGAEVAAALNEGTWTWGIVLMGVYLVLLFPDGHLPSPRWRALAWVAGIDAAVVVPLGITLSPGTLEEAPTPGMDNPLAVTWLAPVADALTIVGLPLIPLSILAAAVALAQRFRRSLGAERLQITWLAAAGVVVATLYAVTLAATLGADILSAGSPEAPPLLVRLLQEASILSFLLLPLAIGAAILRHRLYDIDLVINRALVYGSLTATLVATYLVSVLLLQLALQPLTERSDLAVAASTLAVAALFGPARRRIQVAVDRRFYRHKYDAARTVAEFSARLRREIDLDAIGSDLVRVADDAVQPTVASLWLSSDRSVTVPGRTGTTQVTP